MKCVFVRQGSSESESSISTSYVKSMLADISVLLNCIIARQGSSESAFSISMRYVLSMFDEHVDDETPSGPKVAPK